MINRNSNLNISHFEKDINILHSERGDLINLDGFGLVINSPVIKEKRTRKRNQFWLDARKEYENFVVYSPPNIRALDGEFLGNDEWGYITHENFLMLKDFDYGRDYKIRNYLIDRWMQDANNYVDDVTDKTIYYYAEHEGKRLNLFIPYQTRFDASYKKEQVAKFISTVNALELKGSILFVTVTIDPKHYRTMKDADIGLREKQNWLISIIKSKRPDKKVLKYMNDKKGGSLGKYELAKVGIKPDYNVNYFRYIHTTETQTNKTYELHNHEMMSFNPPDNSEDVNEKIFDDFYHWAKSMWDYRWGIDDKHKIGTIDVRLVQEYHNPLTGNYFSKVTYYDTNPVTKKLERLISVCRGRVINYMLKYLYKGLSTKGKDQSVNPNNVRLWVANSRTFDGTRVTNWRNKNKLPPARDLINTPKNNSKIENTEENTKLEIIWHYGGRFFIYEIGGITGLYEDEELDASVLELLYKRISMMMDAG